MKVIATNISEVKEVLYLGEKVKTGIYKYPVSDGIHLEQKDVKGDNVVDRDHHGGIYKACYLYSLEHYAFWKQEYPDLEWTYGMFGENLTVLGLDERLLKIGAKYKIGEAILEIAQPRQPCFKLGIRFDSQTILGKFINTTYSGVYVKILKNGLVKEGDKMELIEDKQDNPTVADVFYCMYQREIKRSILDKVLNCEVLNDRCKGYIKKKL